MCSLTPKASCKTTTPPRAAASGPWTNSGVPEVIITAVEYQRFDVGRDEETLDMELPEASPVPIIDSFVQLTLGGTVEVPMPREALRDQHSLENWPSTDITGHLFKRDPDR